MKAVPVKSAEEFDPRIPDTDILGTYEGECADASITNANGLDITQEVWDTVFESDAYKKAIKLGWYIGYLGHPEDPNCMDFRNACIVMREGHIEPSGKVKGKFDLINTPVGRIVYAFQLAGVKFGISVRGAGDIIGNSVDPETFVFRGFDLVTFPAYPDAIPTFSAIAASTDLEARKKYDIVCSAVKDNLKDITSAESLAVLKTQFAPQSEEYKAICAKEEALAESPDESDDDVETEVLKQKLEGMTALYLEEVEANTRLLAQMAHVNASADDVKRTYQARQRVVDRIIAAQSAQVDAYISDEKAKSDATIKQLKSNNLKYKQEISASAEAIRQKDSVISGLRSKLSETVRANSELEARSSDLDASNKKLRADVTASQHLLSEYQQAYVSLYASLAGVDVDSLSISASTSVGELKSIIRQAAASTRAKRGYAASNVPPVYEGSVNLEDNMIIL